MAGHDAAAYTAMLRALLPRGVIWTAREGAGDTLAALLQAKASGLARVEGDALRLRDEADPQTATGAIADWERVCGLPDQCGTPADTLAERRAQVLRKLVRPVGQDAAFFMTLAESLGYAGALVEEFSPFAVDVSGVEDALNDAPGGAAADYGTVPATLTPSLYDGWRFVFLLRVPGNQVRLFGVDESGAEDRLATWGDARLECIINRARPAHVAALFGYGPEENPYA